MIIIVIIIQVLEKDAGAFALDRRITPETKDEVILRSIERLLERDNPSLEMIKMQVEYDSTYLNEDNEAQKKLKARQKMLSSHRRVISEVKMEDAQDYEALTVLHRKIFKFLLEFAPNSKTSDKGVEREIAAALESVFPRVGLKAFIHLNEQEKSVQLLELAKIVLGIRLFQRDDGRGGAGLDNMEKDALRLADVLLTDTEKEIEYFSDACEKYQRAIVRAYLYRRKKKFMVKEADRKLKEAEEEGLPQYHRHGLRSSEMFLISQLEDVNDYVIERWSQELANRRQYMNFLLSLLEELKFIQQKIRGLHEKLTTELTTVRSLVSNKSSVPKEVVYPRFESVGDIWCKIYEEVVVMVACSNTFQVLNRYRLSFSPTLADELHGDEDELGADGKAIALSLHVSGMDGAASNMAEAKSKRADGSDGATGDEAKIESDAAGAKSVDTRASFVSSGAVILTTENTPDFQLLPLELQGFCPWTIAETRGLLLPGKPHFGIVRYENRYYVFDHAMALQSFMRSPDQYLQAIRDRALRNPEYIHLLRLNHWFPTANLQKLLEKRDAELNNLTGQPFTKDVGVGTPVHFTETHIVDLNYHWNEWELRRRALKIVNLKHCATHGSQTDASHFRRENDSQVYAPRENETQTKRDKGTNPPIVTTYVTGLRGQVVQETESVAVAKRSAPPSASQAKASSSNKQPSSSSSSSSVDDKDEKDQFARCKVVHPKVALVKLTLDL
jgi:hypothetical protein